MTTSDSQISPDFSQALKKGFTFCDSISSATTAIRNIFNPYGKSFFIVIENERTEEKKHNTDFLVIILSLIVFKHTNTYKNMFEK